MLTAIVLFVGNTFYIIFVSGEVQPWNSSTGGVTGVSVRCYAVMLCCANPSYTKGHREVAGGCSVMTQDVYNHLSGLGSRRWFSWHNARV